MRGAIGSRDILIKGHWSVAEASSFMLLLCRVLVISRGQLACGELDWDAMETDLSNQFLHSKFV